MRKKFKVGDRVRLKNYRDWGDCEITKVYNVTPRRYMVRRLNENCLTFLCRVKRSEIMEVKRGRSRRP